MINPIFHRALRAVPMIHDEEAPTVLELAGQLGAKMNEVVNQTNENTENLESAINDLPEMVDKALEEQIDNGALEKIVGAAAMGEIGADLHQLDQRISGIVAQSGDGNTEIVDARLAANSVRYNTLGEHLRDLGWGHAFWDAVRPGTVKAGRLSAGMFTGDMRDVYTIREIIPLAGHWNENGYYDDATLDKVEHAGYYISDPIPCEYGDIFLIDTAIYGNKVYPACVLTSSGAPRYVAGNVGKGDWTIQRSEVHITGGDDKFIRVLCGTGEVSKMRVYRITTKHNPDIDAAMNAKGYIHTWAKKRTDTITDRAQVKMWFKLPASRAAETVYNIQIQLYKWYNLAGVTFRVFGAASDSTYEMQLAQSAAGYTFATGYGLNPFFTVPLTTDDGTPITHVCLFIDLLPARPDEVIQAFIPYLTMNGIEATGYQLHGGLDTDHLSLVLPGSFRSHLHGKRVLGVGDSLMAAYQLKRSDSWFDIMAGNKGMIWHNAAIAGNSIAGAASMLADFDSYVAKSIEVMGAAPDYLILQGGANDLRLGNSLADFRTAIETIVQRIRQHAPTCMILFVTNWRRSDYVNGLGLREEDYVAEMLKIGEELDIPTYNAYARSINLKDAYTRTWAEHGEIHFSKKANEVIARQIGAALEEV